MWNDVICGTVETLTTWSCLLCSNWSSNWLLCRQTWMVRCWRSWFRLVRPQDEWTQWTSDALLGALNHSWTIFDVFCIGIFLRFRATIQGISRNRFILRLSSTPEKCIGENSSSSYITSYIRAWLAGGGPGLLQGWFHGVFFTFLSRPTVWSSAGAHCEIPKS